jgi:hypothetical protein
MNILEQNKILLNLCPIPQIIQEMIFNILVGYGTPSANILKDPVITKDNFIKRIIVISFGRVGRMIIRHSPKFLNYCELLDMHANSTYFSLETIYELHVVYLKNKIMTPYRIRKLQDLRIELHNNMKLRLVKTIEEEK